MGVALTANVHDGASDAKEYARCTARPVETVLNDLANIVIKCLRGLPEAKV